MAKTMKTTKYYYDKGNGEAGGPLGLEAIRAAVHAGRLAAGVKVTPADGSPDATWLPWDVVAGCLTSCVPVERPREARATEPPERESATAAQWVGELLGNPKETAAPAPPSKPWELQDVVSFLGGLVFGLGILAGLVLGVRLSWAAGIGLAVASVMQGLVLLCLGAILRELRVR